MLRTSFPMLGWQFVHGTYTKISLCNGVPRRLLCSGVSSAPSMRRWGISWPYFHFTKTQLPSLEFREGSILKSGRPNFSQTGRIHGQYWKLRVRANTDHLNVIRYSSRYEWY